MNLNETALIVIDSGFSKESIGRTGRVIAAYDLVKGRSLTGSPTLSAESLDAFAGDPLNHGSIVLDKLACLVPGAPFILIRALSADNHLCRTQWSSGAVVRNGWTEAYRWAVNICRTNGLRSVANCSFGSFADGVAGSGWESFQLAQETGAGKPNHIVVAAAVSLDRADSVQISAPAVFPQVIGVGMRSATCAAEQMAPGKKPNVLLTGNGPVSFRIPEVTAAAARLLMETAVGLDVVQMSALVGKFPNSILLSNGMRV